MKEKVVKFAAIALFACVIAAPVMSTLGADSDATKAFKPLVTPEEVFNLKSTSWKSFPDKDSFSMRHDGESYLVAAKREDGTLMVIVRAPSSEHPGQMFYSGSYLKCGVMADVPFFPSDPAGLKKEMAAPQADDSESKMGFDTTTGMNDLYSLVCPN